ncbi:FKBP-type peptidyl-prolyl cis-trans isomerase [Alkalilimnicola sp. S0819]|uniref:FKBP-type peptidyl-prolyl cis-trans isomerase n=1 Tax=Alkalilimnicola sp. S0819 TaxID=2613922 RepID=UPI0012624D12|nr:peptidylprolyl isomerase [Alkalilimnicola sp. S0819]KAB7628329.1 peptidylprolyl isomerase [Alkalilimnicola sp. S0819]MPQ15228.1 peptidylprolyl isomerase [Alkalilimnicola sp. S0819]
MQIAKDTVVSIDYTLTDPQGTLLDSSEGREPLAYLHGARNIIPGLEKALEGKQAGDSVEVTIEPAEGYGERDDNLQQEVPKEMFEGVDQVQPGMQFQAQTPAGAQVVTVKDVQEQTVTVDANHPLAGVTLNFKVDVRDVRDASSEELEHGHPHGPEGHQH